jgi:hypothetical protein
MTSITVQDGKILLRDGAIGTGQACCCGEPPECESDEDCPEGECCVDGQCGPCPCESDEDCPESECCNDGECGPCEEECSGPCDEENPCPEGCICCNGECVEEIPEGECCGPCDEENPCPEGCACVDGECETEAACCDALESLCLEFTDIECADSNECPDGYTCAFGTCERFFEELGDCPEGTDTVNSGTVPCTENLSQERCENAYGTYRAGEGCIRLPGDIVVCPDFEENPLP